MKTRYLGILLVALAALLSFQAVQAAPTLTFTFDTLPPGGAISGAPGQTVGWGYTIANKDLTNWLVVSNLTASSFIAADPNPLGIFDFPIVPPNTTVTTPYVPGIAGLYEVTVKFLPPVSFESGIFTVAADWFDGDPSAELSQVILSDQTHNAPYSLTISTPAASVPEPSTWLLLVTGLGGLAFLEMLAPVRSHRRRSMRIRLALFLVAAAPLLLLAPGNAMAGGGFFPALPSDPPFSLTLNTSGQVTAVIVLDPNGPVSSGAPATPTGAFGTIAITQKRVGTATATFQVEPGSSLGELRFGCNLLDTNARFVEFSPGVPGVPIGGPDPFGNWLSTAVTTKLFTQLGIILVDPNTFTVLRVPGIANVISQKCVPFPKKDDTLDFLMLNEILEKNHIKPLPPKYPDLTIVPAPTNPAQQWVPGFLVLEVTIGFWAAPSTSTP